MQRDNDLNCLATLLARGPKKESYTTQLGSLTASSEVLLYGVSRLKEGKAAALGYIISVFPSLPPCCMNYLLLHLEGTNIPLLILDLIDC